jgi:hypothetical protein
LNKPENNLVSGWEEIGCPGVGRIQHKKSNVKTTKQVIVYLAKTPIKKRVTQIKI